MKKITNPRNLPYAGATVQAVLFAIAGQKALPYVGWLVGLGAGAVVNYSIALASSRIGEISDKRKGLARLALTGMWLISPAVIALSLFAPESIYSAIAWAVCVDTAIILAGSITGKSLIPQEKPAKPARKPKAAKEKPIEPATEPAKPAFICSCGATFGTQPALNAHQRKHKRIIGYTASFEPVTEQKANRVQ